MKNNYSAPEFQTEKLMTSDVITISGGENLNDVAAGTGGEGGYDFNDL